MKKKNKGGIKQMEVKDNTYTCESRFIDMINIFVHPATSRNQYF